MSRRATLHRLIFRLIFPLLASLLSCELAIFGLQHGLRFRHRQIGGRSSFFDSTHAQVVPQLGGLVQESRCQHVFIVTRALFRQGR